MSVNLCKVSVKHSIKAIAYAWFARDVFFSRCILFSHPALLLEYFILMLYWCFISLFSAYFLPTPFITVNSERWTLRIIQCDIDNNIVWTALTFGHCLRTLALWRRWWLRNAIRTSFCWNCTLFTRTEFTVMLAINVNLLLVFFSVAKLSFFSSEY